MSGRCDDGHCVTCADEGVPMRVIEVRDGSLARCVDVAGAVSEVVTDLVAPVGAGDEVLVHAGVALTVLAPR